MNLHFPFLIQVAGVIQLVIAFANFLVPAKLHYRENLVKLSTIVRQVFIVHSVYIVMVLVGLGGICLLFPWDLCGDSALGKFLCGFMAIFWGLRLILQCAYYDSAIKRENPLGTLVFGVAFFYLAAIFATTTILSL